MHDIDGARPPRIEQKRSSTRWPSSRALVFVLMCVVLVTVAVCARQGTVIVTPPAPTPLAAGDTFPFVPDTNKTPGATLAVEKSAVCVPGYSKKVRDVPTSEKNEVYASYGIAHREPGEYEVDHLISLELGGSNAAANLWPESYVTQPWNAHVKDALENELHREVCAGTIDLTTAQHEISHDWIVAYKKYFHTDRPIHAY